MTLADTSAWRDRLAARTAGARNKALSRAPAAISVHSRSTLEWLLFGDQASQQDALAAAERQQGLEPDVG